MESCGHDSSLPNRNRVFAFSGQDFDVGAHALNFWCAYENHLERGVSQLVRNESAFADGAVELASVGIAPDGDVDGAKAGLLWIFDLGGQQNCAGASAERRLAPHEFL